MKKLFSEFEAFISRGNVLDLAVAVIIGAAFSKIVDSLVKDIINPILGIVVGRPDFSNLYWVLKAPPADYAGPQTYDALVKAGATVFGYGAFLTTIIQFLLMAWAIFLLIKMVNAARAKIVTAAEQVLGDKAQKAAQAQEAAKKAEEAQALEAKQKAEAAAAAAQKNAEDSAQVLREIRDLLAKNLEEKAARR